MHNIVRFFLKCLLSVLTGEKALKICWLGQRFQWKKEHGKSCGCLEKRCGVCIFLEEKSTFTNKEGSHTYKIREGLHLDCNSENVAYLITCKKCRKNSMQEVLFLGFPHISIITAVVTGSFVGAILLFRFHFTLILC